jgi:hypothetical protein
MHVVGRCCLADFIMPGGVHRRALYAHDAASHEQNPQVKRDA